MLDCPLVANECIDYCRKKKVYGVIYQIDMEMAYDHVNWEFLDWILWKMGVWDKWCFLIRVCISSAAYSILLNGTSTGFSEGKGVSGKGIPSLCSCSIL